MIPTISFWVSGIPKPSGSKRGFYIKKLNRVNIVDACKTSRDWKTDVKYAAQDFCPETLLDMPLKVKMEFFVTRPQAHFRTGKNAGLLRDGAPVYPGVKPDVLKLARAVEDACTGLIWKDDSLIVHETIIKRYGPCPGVMVTVSEMCEV